MREIARRSQALDARRPAAAPAVVAAAIERNRADRAQGRGAGPVRGLVAASSNLKFTGLTQNLGQL